MFQPGLDCGAQSASTYNGTFPFDHISPHALRIIIFHDDGSHKNAIRYAVREYTDVFASIWIITNNQICSLTVNERLGKICQFSTIRKVEDLL